MLSDFNACGPIVQPLDRAVFEGSISGNIQGVVQYNDDHPDRPIPPLDTTGICRVMTASGDHYTNLVGLTKTFQNGTCIDVSYADQIAELSNVTFDGERADRQWIWQTCNEYGFYQTSTAKDEPFAAMVDMTLDSNMAICRDVFGSNANPDIAMVDAVFGALQLAGSRIVLPNGSIDPWHALGFTDQTRTVDPTEYPLYITGTAHCADLYAPSAQDIPALVNARQKIAAAVYAWLTAA